MDIMQASSSGRLSGLIDIISGVLFQCFQYLQMTISPYITASIVLQLLGMVIPSLERLMKEGGEEGKAKINRYTKYLTILLALIEGTGIYLSYQSSGIFINPGFFNWSTSCTITSSWNGITYVVR